MNSQKPTIRDADPREQTAHALPAQASSNIVMQPRRVTHPARHASITPTVLSNAPDPAGLLRALHRRLPLALGLGLGTALLAGSVAWFLVPPAKFSAKAILQVNPQSPALLFNLMDNPTRYGDDYKRFQSNQVNTIYSALVLNAALLKLDVKTFQTFKHEPSAIDFLKRELRVGFINGSDLLEVELSGEHPKELAEIVNKVMDAYKEEVVYLERKRRAQRFDMLKRTADQQSKDLKIKHDEKRRLAVSVGTEDPETIAIKQQIQEQALSDLERELFQIRSERQRLEVDSEVAERLTAASDRASEPISREELEAAIDQVPSVARLRAEAERAAAEFRKLEAGSAKTLRNPQNEPVAKSMRAEAERLANRLQQERATYRPIVTRALASARNTTRIDDLMKLKLQATAWKNREEKLRAEINERSGTMHQLNNESLDLKEKQRDIEQLDRMNAMIREELAKLEVELQAPERVLLVEEAKQPEFRDEKKRYMMIGTATAGAFFACLGLVTFLEFRARKLGSAEEVVEGLGIQLVGSLPPLPARRRRHAVANLEESDWYQMLLESIDATRTMLVHHARAGDLRVLLVTSALGGEGKTSLSCHLATSLARGGFRTLLIDADLRSPAAAHVFGLPSGPGLAELLCGEVTIDDALIASPMPGLTVLPAGACDERALRRLVQGALEPLFATLRGRFEFIVVDSAPVLPVADTQIIAPHVDAVVLSTLRDVSRLPKVFLAYQRLAALGVRFLGAVVTGVSGGLYGHDPSYGSNYGYAGRGRRNTSASEDAENREGASDA
jgi:succinoglycan biosynthesis transport protein ExoP